MDIHNTMKEDNIITTTNNNTIQYPSFAAIQKLVGFSLTLNALYSLAEQSVARLFV